MPALVDSSPTVLSFLNSNPLPIWRLGIAVFALEQYEDAIHQLRTGAIAKAVFDLSLWYYLILVLHISARPVKDYCQQYNVRLVPRMLLKVLHWQGKGRQLEVRAQHAPWLLWEDRCVTLLMMSASWKVPQMFVLPSQRADGFAMSFSVFGRQQQACRPKNKPKYIWCFAKARGIKHRNPGWPANMFNIFCGDQCKDLTN